ncbi:hypothetical protein HIV01_012345 [Lysobacter arenosi]|uniref:MBL fold metallo-hydrolase n=1 Tax=Lysobacter arenosi TaxID=2795387 RepID=A0ABX7RAJ3_9GAMM|nr:hypothetical protein [Lysobacter arenosi]QSX74007.1 hypothetical protein HIV01_012345 [Lysobacter arenosi]
MPEIFDIKVFPAQRGDAILVEYADAAAPQRILIDGGITRTARDYLLSHFGSMGAGTRIDVLVVTHLDQDHIQGAVTLLKELPANVTIGSVWFNGKKHLPLQPQGIADAVELTALLEGQHAQAWAVGTGDQAICVGACGEPRSIELPGGMSVTVLSPDAAKLKELALHWQETLEEMGASDVEVEAAREVEDAAFRGLEPMGPLDVTALAEQHFDEDDAAPNGSSIALLLEFQGKRALMLGDAHPSLVLSSLKQLSPAGPMQVDCVKLSHHGSRRNTSMELVGYLRSGKWIVSSNGAQTKHPNLECIARVLHGSPGHKSLYFNYRTPYNEMWDDYGLMTDHDYEVEYGDGSGPMELHLIG